MEKNDLSELKKNIKRRYKNGPDNIGKDFISPCLKNAVLYRRGTGFFSSGALANYASAMQHLIQGRTKIEIICSPVIHDKKLIDIIEKNTTEEKRHLTIQKLSDEIVLNAIGFSIDSTRRDYKNRLLAYLIAKEILEIRFAIPINFKDVKSESDQELTNNLYHVKTGYFKLTDDSIVAFDGSFNESESGHQHHIDQTQVWRSWHAEDSERLNDVIEDIDSDWIGANPYIKIFKISPEALTLIKNTAPKTAPKNPVIEPKLPETQVGNLREYQKEALLSWAKNNYRGILALATGTGKTKTAIYAIKEFRKKNNSSLVIVTVPYLPLAKQWITELNRQNLPTIEIFDSKQDWLVKAQNLLGFHNQPLAKKTEIPVFVCVNKSFRSELFQSLLNRLVINEEERLLIVDECHHFNKEEQIRYLPEKINYRLGLSATPYEPDRPHLLESYFGDHIYSYSLKEAISDGYLTPYEYFPIFVEFTFEEAEAYIKTIKKLQGTKKSDLEPGETEKESLPIFDELDRILETVVGKLSKLEEILMKTGPTYFTLFYCGQGYVEIDNEKVRQVEILTRLLSKLKWKVGRITYSESMKDKMNTLTEFQGKNIHAVASMRILDEGIDVPDCTVAYILASQRLLRQGVQRRGRILRPSENKKIAKLYDFIITGPKLSNQELEKLYSRELQRAKMFAEDAINKLECELLLEGI